MLKTNALKLRQSLGILLRKIEKTGEPILIERNRHPAAVLISLDDYQKRFVDHEADQQRKDMVARIKSAKGKPPTGKTALELIREMRS